MQHYQFSNIQIPLTDYDLISQQQSLRKANHPSREKSKASLAQVVSSLSVATGDLVYLYCDRNKSRRRDPYLVTSIDGAWCQVRKFVGAQLRSKLSATKYLWMLHLPCHITRAVHASTPMTRLIPPCLQPHHHRYRQLLPHPHLNCSHRCLLLSLLLLLILIQILTLHPYRLPATSQTRTSYPNDPQALAALRNT